MTSSAPLHNPVNRLNDWNYFLSLDSLFDCRSDTTVFWGATLSVTLGNTYHTGDRLQLAPTSTVSVVGSRVFVNGVAVGVQVSNASAFYACDAVNAIGPPVMIRTPILALY